MNNLWPTKEIKDGNYILTADGITIELSKELVQSLDIEKAIQDLSRTCVRLKNRYKKKLEK